MNPIVEKAMWGALFGIAVLALMVTVALAVAEVAMAVAKGLTSVMEWAKEDFA